MKSPVVSILMPVYNSELYLEACLKSIQDQSFPNWELLAINDQSEDKSRDILTAFSNTDDRIKVFDNQHKGIVGALNLAYKNSSGDYITRMDSDDLMPMDKLQSLLKLLRLSGQGHVSTGKVSYFATGKNLDSGYKTYEKWLNDLVERQEHWENIYKECVIASPNWMIAKSDLDKIGGICSGVYPEDYELVFRMYKSGLKVSCSEDVTHLWRDHYTRTSRTSEVYRDNRFLELKCTEFVTDKLLSNGKLMLWGAGGKGKTIAKALISANIPFDWVTNNSNKIGHQIYGKYLVEAFSNQMEEAGTAIIATTQDKEQIRAFCHSTQTLPIWFC